MYIFETPKAQPREKADVTRPPGFAVFDTTLGVAAVAWRGERIVAVQLPEPTADEARRRALRRVPDAELSEPPPVISAVMADVVAMLAGEARAVDGERLDLSATGEFERRVYAAALRVPYGRTTTYGEIARELGGLGLSQAVGRALGANPIPILVPCLA